MTKKTKETPKTTQPKPQQKSSSNMGLKAFVLVVLVFGLGYYGYHNNDQVKQFVDNFSQQAESVATQVKTQVKSTIQATSDDGVLVLTDSNFQEQIKANEYVLVEFYATWCGHCKKLAPEYAKAAEVLKSNKSPVVLAKVEATESPNIAKEHDIKGYPTLKFFHNGQATEYDGGRTTSEIVNWLNKKTGLVSTHLQSVEAIAQFKKDNKVCIIVYTESDITDVFSAVKAAALEMDKVSFAHVTDAALVKGEQAKNGDVVLFRKFEEPRNLFEGKVTKENVLAWVNKMRIPAIMEFDDDAIELVFQSKLVSLIIFHNKSEKSLTARKLFDQVANEGKGNSLNYVTCTPTDASGHYARLAEFLGADVSNQDVPRLVLLDTSEGKIVKFLFSEEFSVENLKKFQQDFFDKNLKQALKSQEIPPESEQGDVRVIVGKAFQAEVLDTKKDVLVKFYAPWCGHCKSLAPHWEEAAAKLKKVNPNIVLAKVDSTLNEVEGIDIQGYPTLKFFPGNNKSNVQEFDGDRSTEGILKWLKEHTTHEWVELNKEEAKTDL